MCKCEFCLVVFRKLFFFILLAINLNLLALKRCKKNFQKSKAVNGPEISGG